MPSVQVNTNFSIGGIAFGGNFTRTGTGQVSAEVSKADSTLTVATTGTLTTRTDDDTGVVTSSGHGLVTSDVVDVYWTGGVRYGMTATVSGDAVTVEGGITGGGDVLPAQDTSVYICKQTDINVDFDADDAKVIAVLSNVRGYVVFSSSGPTELSAYELIANEPFLFVSSTQDANANTGNPIDIISVSVGSTSTSATIKVGALYDA